MFLFWIPNGNYLKEKDVGERHDFSENHARESNGNQKIKQRSKKKADMTTLIVMR